MRLIARLMTATCYTACFDTCNHSNATRDYLNQHIGAFHSNRFKLQCDQMCKKVRKVGDCVGILIKLLMRLLCSTTHRLSGDKRKPR